MVPQYVSILVGVQKRNRHDVDEADDDDGDGDGDCRTLGFSDVGPGVPKG